MTPVAAPAAAATSPIGVSLSVDALSGTMALIVTGVGFLIHLYSSKYMEDDPGYHRFFTYLNLFIFSMLVLILGDSLPVLFVGWEGVGLCSYLLIGFWFRTRSNAAAGKKAFITNRIGDFGLLVAMGLLLYYTRRARLDGHRGRRAATCCSRCRSGRSATHVPLAEPAAATVGEVAQHAASRVARRRWSAWRCSWAAPARARRCRSTSGCRTRWPAQRRSAR